MAVGAVVARILTQYSDKGSKQAQKDIQKLGRKIDAFASKATKSFIAVGAATAAMAVKIGTDAVKAAIEDSKSQAILANNLRNVTGATDATIKSVEEYITKQQMLANVSDTELRASFAQLVTATGDVTTAMDLQSVALDTAAGTGSDLGAVSKALARASQGNLTALKKIVPALDNNIIKNKDLGAALVFLDKTYKGSAKTIGDTDPLKKLQLAYGEVLETLGYALLPVVVEFAEYIRTDVLPNIEAWVAANETQLAESFKGTLNAVKSIVQNLVTLTLLIEKYKVAVLAAGAIGSFIVIGGQLKIIYDIWKNIDKALPGVFKGFKYVASSIGKVITAIRLLGLAFTAMGARAAIAAIPVAFATAGVSVATAAAALAAVGIGAFAIKKGMDAFTGSTDKAADAAVNLKKQIYGGAAAEKYKAEVAAKEAKDKLARDKRLAAIQAKQAANDKKNAAIDAKNAALKKRLEDKYGLKLTDAAEYENIQLTAVEKLLAKQKDADKSLTDRIKLRKEELALFQALNENAQRYTDLLQALADEKLSNQEIELLAKKWGLTVDAAKSYIFTVFAIKDEQISDDEITKLASAWGITKAQAGQYLDFFAALNDGKLSDAEIAKLMAKWGLTKDEAKKYADFVAAIGDGKLDDSEITKLKNTWGLTTQQVVDYIIKIGGKVDASGTILSAGDIAALGWTNALNALNAYLAALGKGTGGTPTNPVVPPVVVPVVPVVPGLGGSRTDSAAAAASAAASKKAAEAYAVAKAKGDMNAAAIAAAGVSPSALASQESGAIGAASIAAQLRAAEAAQAAAKQASSLAAFKAKEANDAAASRAMADALDYDERSKFRSMTMANASSISGSGSGTPANITINVSGSVTTEQDLVQTVRNGLLAAQTNGQGLTLQAI